MCDNSLKVSKCKERLTTELRSLVNADFMATTIRSQLPETDLRILLRRRLDDQLGDVRPRRQRGDHHHGGGYVGGLQDAGAVLGRHRRRTRVENWRIDFARVNVRHP